MNKYHQEILQEIKKIAREVGGKMDTPVYNGTNHPQYYLTNPEIREIARKWAGEHKDISLDVLLELLDSLYMGESHTEKSFGGKLLQYLPKQKAQVNTSNLDKWLDHLEGWSEIDSLCQSVISAKDMLDDWDGWEQIITEFSNRSSIAHKRASLVLLTGPVVQSEDERLANLAFINIDRLKSKKDILITKAISWLLRSMITNFRDQVETYISKYADMLPKIALRETTNKLLNGKK